MTKLLCASTSPKFRDLYCGIFAAAGHDVLCPYTIDEATRALHRETCDLIITDLSFGSDSSSLISVARKRGVPLIVISRDIPKFFHPPYADLYLELPTAAKELLAIINQFLTARAPAAEPTTQAAVA